MSLLPISLTQTHGFGSQTVSLLFMLFYAAVGLSQIVAGARVWRYGVLVWCMALAAIGMGTFSLLPGLWPMVRALASIGLDAFCVSSIAALKEGVWNAFKGTISGSYYRLCNVVFVRGPILIGATVS